MENWFSRSIVDEKTTMLTEPFVHDYVRANIWHLTGRDADLLVDTGMGICPLAPEIETRAGKPLIAVATHIHLDHVGSLHEFALRAGPRVSAAQFENMDEATTYAYMFHDLDGAVSQLPAPGWKAADYKIPPAPLTRTLDEGDVVDLGDRRFRVLHLPGHSPDSIALFDEADGLFFSGDAIYDDRLIDDLPDSDKSAYCLTMRRLLDLPIRIGHGGHGPSFDGERMREIASAYLSRAAGP
ncbi:MULTISPECIES: MBL fold metallo-hydrolase [unclassified Mesorhizobium]|uniref:MBL fold metallo-hydrolase n=1 Tax=unclassified Mesorhizobium TaxID=325217 RepID=UPI0011292180|nr:MULTISPECIES: MBL fold metallo-hydrolase [unclassified Mesorhizobium]MCA0028871.1 MBL fold metallo-hydrolase [Mesorhizobium sp. B263B1A]TPK00367.1 MBL fold metallo-hydrolase [Mesorhizobium sp. B2-5-12]TPK27669.1 MBL fold metallo-hydrolase [Mesorhizobium sp. B2-5-6]TPN29022.1 MBL fold metallo-hydrolase [Mesorhizobium sp. B1-1-6]